MAIFNHQIYRKLLTTEYRIIRRLQDKIKNNAVEVYKHKINHGNATALAKRCNDFRLLEEKCNQFVSDVRITKIYFVRHAQPEHMWEDDRTRPLTAEGKKDAEIVLDFLRIIDWMPYIIELDFDGDRLLSMKEHCYIEKEFQGTENNNGKA